MQHCNGEVQVRVKNIYSGKYTFKFRRTFLKVFDAFLRNDELLLNVFKRPPKSTNIL